MTDNDDNAGMTPAQSPEAIGVHTAGEVSNQTPEWRAVTAAISGYRVVQDPYLRALGAADIIGIAQAVLRVHPPAQTDASMQAMARSAEFRAISAEAAAADLLEAAEKLERAEDHYHNDCRECEGEGVPELCETCFPLFDDARIARRAAIAKATGQ